MTQSRDGTRDRILEAAESIFSEKGYHDALVDEIASRTSLSKGGVYFHFPSKEGLFFAVLDRLADRLISRVEESGRGFESPLARAEASLEAAVRVLGRKRALARLLIIQGYTMGNAFERKRVEIYRRFGDLIRRHLDDAVAAGEIESIDTAVAAHVWLGAVNEVVIRWVYGEGVSPSEALPVLKSILVGGMRRSTATPSPESSSLDGLGTAPAGGEDKKLSDSPGISKSGASHARGGHG